MADEKRVKHWGSLPLEPGLVRDGLIADPAKVSSAIDTLFSKNKMSRRRVIASLTGLRSIHRVFSLPAIKSSLLEEAIRHESEREMPVPLEEIYLSWQSLETTESTQKFFVIGTPRNLLDIQFQTLAQAGVTPCVMNLKPLALARAADREEALIIDLEIENFDLVIVVDGIPTIMRTIISRGEGIILEDRIRQLTEEVSRTVDFYNTSHHEHALGPAIPTFLTGSLASDATARGLVEKAIQHPVEVFDPPLECPGDLPKAEYAVNIGLALRQVTPKTTARSRAVSPRVAGLNVLPREYRPQPLSIARIFYLLAPMVLVVLMVLMYQVKSDTGTEIANIQTEHLDRAIAAAINTETATATLEEERETLISTYSLSDSLNLIFSALPSGVQLTSATQSENEITLHGEAGSRSGAIDYVATLEESGAFSRVYVVSLSGGDGTNPATFSIVAYT